MNKNNIEEIKEQLIDLKYDRESFITGDKDNDEIYIQDMEALDAALELIEEMTQIKRLINRRNAMIGYTSLDCIADIEKILEEK